MTDTFSLRERVYELLMCDDPGQKVEGVHALCRVLDSAVVTLQLDTVQSVPVPGRPDRPVLVHPRDVAKRGTGSARGKLAQLHAFAHIEFNAINLALDAVYRFAELPASFYTDWLKVADDEARHFSLLRTCLQNRGTDYGEFSAHNNLWDMAVDTDHDILARMALVPRVLEARGLDVTPGIIDRYRRAGDSEVVAILETIYTDEIGHVAVGNRWFHHVCECRALEPEQAFRELLIRYGRGYLNGPFNREGRIQAGFSESELETISALAQDFRQASKRD